MGTVGEDRTRENSAGESGWVTTQVAADALGVDPRTVRTYISRGILQAKVEGEGVDKAYSVDIDSLYALRDARKSSGKGPRKSREKSADAEGLAELVRDLTAQVIERSSEAADLRARLQLTERAQSTLEDERRRALEELAGERRRREEVEQERDELHHWRAPWWLLALLVVLLFASVSFLVFFMVSFGVPLGGGVLGA
jgi:hypothetical protein